MKKFFLTLFLIPSLAWAGLPPNRCTGLNFLQCLPGEIINASSVNLGSQVTGNLPVANMTTVNPDVGTYNIADITVNAQGLITAAAPANAADIVALFTGCVGVDYLGADGACHSASGAIYYQIDQLNGSAKPQEPVNNFSSNFALTDNSGVATNIDLAATISSSTTGNAATATNITGLSPNTPVVSNGSSQVVSGSVVAPLTYAAGAFGCQTASGSQAGCIDTTDWNTFNNKSPAGNYATSGSGDVDWSAPSGPGAVTTSLVATTNSTLTTLSALALPYSQLTGAPTFYYQTVESTGTPATQRSTLDFSSDFTIGDSTSPARTTVALSNPLPTPSPSAFICANGAGTSWFSCPAPSSGGGGGGSITSITGSSPIIVTSGSGPTPNISLSPVPQNLYGTGIDTSASTGVLTYASGTPNVLGTHVGDMIVTGPGPAPSVLPSGAPGTVLTMGAGGQQWSSISAIGISTDWSTNYSFAPSSGFGTVSSASYLSRRVGDSLQVRVTFAAGTVSSSTAFLTMPSGLTIDSTKLPTSSSGSIIGTESMISNDGSPQNIYTPATPYSGVVFYDGSTTNEVFITGLVQTHTLAKVGVSSITGNGNYFTFEFSVPISGWSSNTIGTGQGLVSATYYMSSNKNPSAGGQLNFDTLVFDSGCLGGTCLVTTGSSWEFTAPVSGQYNINSCVGFSAGSADTTELFINGSVVTYFQAVQNITDSGCGSVTWPVSAGQQIDIRSRNGTLTFAGSSFPTASWVSITLVSGNGAGNVSSTTTGQEHIERIAFAGNTTMTSVCTSSTPGSGICAISSQSGSWVTSVTRSGTGNYTVNFQSGEFSSPPTCTASCGVNSNCFARINNPPTTSELNIQDIASAAAVDDGGWIICMGPH